LRMQSGASRWEKAQGDDAAPIVELASQVYPTITEAWKRLLPSLDS